VIIQWWKVCFIENNVLTETFFVETQFFKHKFLINNLICERTLKICGTTRHFLIIIYLTGWEKNMMEVFKKFLF